MSSTGNIVFRLIHNSEGKHYVVLVDPYTDDIEKVLLKGDETKVQEEV